MNISPDKLPELRLATEDDFRTSSGYFLLGMEYYQKQCYSKIWEIRITDIYTNKEWLKVSIIAGNIMVPLTPVFWD